MTLKARLLLLFSLVSVLGALAPLRAQTPTPTTGCHDTLFVSRNVLRPLSGETLEIDVNLCETGHYRVTVYNSAGELVRVLRSNDNQTPLQDPVLWDGKNNQGDTVASGVYLIRFTNPSTDLQSRVIVVH